MRPQARYFPVTAAPLKMVAGLRRHGVDCGEGARDREFFQSDDERARYLRAKRSTSLDRHGLFATDPAAERARAAALVWMRDTLQSEHPQLLAEADADAQARDGFEAIARAVQEDFAVLDAGPDQRGRTLVLDVRFPSGWRPERLVGASFEALHRPVPGFVESEAAVHSMVRAMIERGPYVRFVWTLSADEQLDHHPEVRQKCAWSDAARLWLRVERQVTVPLTAVSASVFLIRTYLYPVEQLSEPQRQTLLLALDALPEDIRTYKGLPQRAQVERFLQ